MRYPEQMVKDFAAAVMEKVGLSPEDARTFAHSLAESEMRGVSSHGITRLKIYSDKIRTGEIRPVADVAVANAGETGAALLLDGANGPGVVVAAKAMDLCIERARKTAACFAAIRNTSHYAAGWYFPTRASRQGLIGFSICNGNPLMVPHGGLTPMLGTNPLTIAIPAGRHPDLVLDMATSAAAKGKVDFYAKVGKPIPEGWMVDKDGLPTTNPADVLSGGAMTAFGGVKGYGIALIIDIVSSALSGAKNGRQLTSFFSCPDPEGYKNVGMFMGALDVEKFVPIDVFRERVDGILDEFKNCPPAKGTDEVMIPGEIEHRKFVDSRLNGIELADNIVAELRGLAAQYGIRDPFR
ncbi:MAG: Ldh family oxidoreductase [Planctomycetota bacterium]|jgi:LDH2 family malate/lactate/ureidoglycolate dehydrogenase|nr:Ldh family oxidoreductase [Planctomycetota bacterium]